MLDVCPKKMFFSAGKAEIGSNSPKKVFEKSEFWAEAIERLCVSPKN